MNLVIGNDFAATMSNYKGFCNALNTSLLVSASDYVTVSSCDGFTVFDSESHLLALSGTEYLSYCLNCDLGIFSDFH